jgi:hypothetical protein
VILSMLMAVGLAACGSSPAAVSTSTSSSTTSTTTVPVHLPSLSASRAQITLAYSVLFDLSDPAVTPKLAVVQDGPTLKAAFTAAIHSALAAEAGGAKVLSVKVEQGTACTDDVLPSPCAAVVYDILSPAKAVLLSGSTGSAVYENSHWLVAKVTICALLTLDNGGKTPAGC